MASLKEYMAKRDLSRSPESDGREGKASGTFRFVVHRHQARRLHYDLRLELGGVLKSWAVPKGLSMDPSQKRLAVQVEDHPLTYIAFSGRIPEGQYGAGIVDIWDQGSFIPLDKEDKPMSQAKALAGLAKGEMKFMLKGNRLKGSFVLVRFGDDPKSWLLIKHKDEQTKPRKGKSGERGPHPPGKPSQGSRERVFRSGKSEVRLSHIQKIFWSEEGFTKGDMLDYYERIAPVILPYLKDRPLSLKRNPNGIGGKSFYHKDAGEHVPSFVSTEQVYSVSSDKIIDYIVCNNPATLMYVANLGSIEMNPWNSTCRKPDHPTYLVLDLDPPGPDDFDRVIETARAAGDVLDRAGADHYYKTSGASGLHIYVPLNARYSYEMVRDVAHVLAIRTHELVPGITTLERMLKKRGDHIYIDYLQNSKGQTLASAYSLRPVKGAQVSAPLLRKEVKPGLHPSRFNMFNIHQRVRKYGDIFSPVLRKGIDVRKCLKKLGG